MNGDRYEGEFKEDFFDGEGVYTYADGTCYKGNFKEDDFPE